MGSIGQNPCWSVLPTLEFSAALGGGGVSRCRHSGERCSEAGSSGQWPPTPSLVGMSLRTASTCSLASVVPHSMLGVKASFIIQKTPQKSTYGCPPRDLPCSRRWQQKRDSDSADSWGWQESRARVSRWVEYQQDLWEFHHRALESNILTKSNYEGSNNRSFCHKGQASRWLRSPLHIRPHDSHIGPPFHWTDRKTEVQRGSGTGAGNVPGVKELQKQGWDAGCVLRPYLFPLGQHIRKHAPSACYHLLVSTHVLHFINHVLVSRWWKWTVLITERGCWSGAKNLGSVWCLHTLVLISPGLSRNNKSHFLCLCSYNLCKND